MANHITDHYAADDAYTYVDFGFDLRGSVDDQCALVREDFAGDMTVDSQHVFETEFAIKFRLRVSWPTLWPLLDRQRAARRSQLSGNNSVNWKRASISCFAGDYRGPRLKAGLFPGLIDGKSNRSDSAWRCRRRLSRASR